jgi:LysR family transcriptional activator of nhaA
MLLPTSEAAIRWELDNWFESLGIKPNCVAEFQDRALMKIAAKDGKGIIALPSVIAKEVARDFDLTILGTTTKIKEKLYLISLERKLQNSLIVEICVKGQKNIFF